MGADVDGGLPPRQAAPRLKRPQERARMQRDLESLNSNLWITAWVASDFYLVDLAYSTECFDFLDDGVHDLLRVDLA